MYYFSLVFREFLKGYLDILRRQYGTRRVHCNVVYQEYIRDRNHFHMNATRVSCYGNNSTNVPVAVMVVALQIITAKSAL